MVDSRGPSENERFTFGAGLWMFGQFIDRYATDAYGPPVTLLEAIGRAGSVADLKVVDINYPFDPGLDVATVKSALDEAGLRAIAVTPVIYTREFRSGSFTNPDKTLRHRAIDLCKRAIDIAQALGADYVKCWPGQDGYDFPGQSNYLELWDLTIEGLSSVASAAPSQQFAIEYKSKEPRAKITLSSAARTILAIQDTGLKNIGVVMDFGHSLFAKETPAEELRLLDRRKHLVSVEMNDNWREWDDDLAVGSIHLLETFEFLHAVREIGWSKPILLDQFPFREDPVRAAKRSISTMRLMEERLDSMDLAALRYAQASQDALLAQEIMQRALLGVR
jgi:xylose isomerase